MFLQRIYFKFYIVPVIIFILYSQNANAQSRDSLILNQLDSAFVKGHISEKDRSSFQTARLNIHDHENPQVTTSVGIKLTQNRNYYTQTAMLSNATGVTPSWAGLAPNFTIRGFRTRSNFRNGLNAYLQYSDDNTNVQQIDVIKGPSGTLFGGANMVFGGLINILTFAPVDSTFTHVSLAAGNNNLQRATMEVNTPLDTDHKTLFRMSGTYMNRKSFQDQGLNKNIFFAPSFSHQVNPKLKVKLEAEFLNKEATNSPLFTPANPLVNGAPVHIQNSKDLKLDYTRSYTDNSILWKTTSINMYGKVSYLISDQWQSETNFASTYGSSKGDYQTNLLVDNNSSVARKVLRYDAEDITNHQIQQNFIGNFSIGNWYNKLLIGLDYYRYSYTANYKNAGYIDTVSNDTPMTSTTLFSEDLISKKVLSKLPSHTTAPQNTYSAYISNVLKPFDALSIMLSARYDRLINLGTKDISTATRTGAYKQSSITPKIGLTYQFIPKTFTIFANYMSGFQNIAPTSIDGVLYNFKPQYGTQWESGIKASSPNQRMDVTISYYNIQVHNTVMTDQHDVTRYTQGGKQYSRGVEVDMQTQPIRNLFLHGGLAYNDSKITIGEGTTKGLRPVNAGPEWSATWYANYQLLIDAESKWTLGLGGNFIGKDLIINNTTAGTFSTDNYTLFNSTVAYHHKKFTCNLTADNLLNEHYYYGGRGFISQGNLRQWILSMSLNL
ncbi:MULTISPECIES: TonB-dependent siderophore receptor [Sphingobacterium]|uniref:TonB-dependent siderophore receptor n=1 Tax=Sphingobacterium TaxID=28453 RepID=UPI001047A223|nr:MULTISPECIES: TonB-dependent receptor [Sphingobacterium]MCW2263154.1 iron complex outermembrane receptor protein [Sphingobacterium kitahiroshimense]TCR11863.1 iron complex outermembrane receptor protein [Sphingobacterium sp. JUb78]